MVISQGFSRNSGKSKFLFDFNNGTDFSMEEILNNEEDSTHVNVLGTLYSGEFTTDEVELEFKLSTS